MGTLYIVATPIGNLEDITVRAAKLLTEVSVIACEDTRHTGILLEHLRNTYLQNPLIAKKPKLISFYEDVEEQKVPYLISILKQGEDVALVSDAGTPGISDPGFTIVRECRNQNIPVIGIPGPSAAILALSISGLPTDKFTFLGYLPKKETHSKKLLLDLAENLKENKINIVLYEAPHKLIQTLEIIKETLGDIDIVLCRELTKKFEEVLQNKISLLLNFINQKIQKASLLFYSIYSFIDTDK